MNYSYLLLFSVFSFASAQAYNLPQHLIKPYVCEECTKLSHDTLHANWRIAQVPLERREYEHKSYSYTMEISGKELRQGVSINTNAPAAVISITPLEKKSNFELTVKTPSQQVLSAQEASAVYEDPATTGDTQRNRVEQNVMQLKPELGFGHFTFTSASANINDKATYLVHVFDKFSTIFLQVEPEYMHYQYGDPFVAKIVLTDKNKTYALNEIRANLMSTDQQKIPLQVVETSPNQFQASILLLSTLNTHGENWYIEVEVVGNEESSFAHRVGRTGFSYSIPAASMLSVKREPFKPLSFSAKVNVATASRYSLQVVLLRQERDGTQIPIEISQNAQWLEPGQQTIKFNFDNSAKFPEDTLSLGYWQLIDYGQLKTIYRHYQPIKLRQITEYA